MNQPDDTIETFIYLNNYIWFLKKNVVYSVNLGFGLEREYVHWRMMNIRLRSSISIEFLKFLKFLKKNAIEIPGVQKQVPVGTKMRSSDFISDVGQTIVEMSQESLKSIFTRPPIFPVLIIYVPRAYFKCSERWHDMKDLWMDWPTDRNFTNTFIPSKATITLDVMRAVSFLWFMKLFFFYQPTESLMRHELKNTLKNNSKLFWQTYRRYVIPSNMRSSFLLCFSLRFKNITVCFAFGNIFFSF